MTSTTFKSLNTDVERLQRGRYQALIVACRELAEQGISLEQLSDLQQLLERFAEDKRVCPFCEGTGLDCDPGMTRYYAEKDLRGRGWQAPDTPVEPNEAERTEIASRLWGERFQRLIDDAWELVSATPERQRFQFELLSAAVAAESASPEALAFSADRGSNCAICDQCLGSGLRSERKDDSAWGIRYGWLPPQPVPGR